MSKNGEKAKKVFCMLYEDTKLAYGGRTNYQSSLRYAEELFVGYTNESKKHTAFAIFSASSTYPLDALLFLMCSYRLGYGQRSSDKCSF